jgi:hypothetical protein
MNTWRGRLWLRGAGVGLVAGTVYFVLIGVLALFGGVLNGQPTSLLWLLLFVGAGAGCGLLLGLWAATWVAAVRRLLHRRAHRSGASVSEAQERWWSAGAAGAAVALATTVSLLSGIPGLLAPDPTTVVVIPVVVAVFAAATASTD